MNFSDTQSIILSAASLREDHAVVLPPNLKGSAAKKVIDKLVNETLLQEVPSKEGVPVWRRDDKNRPYSLQITNDGRKAIAIGGRNAPVEKTGVNSAAVAVLAARTKAPTKRQPRPGKSAAKKKRNIASKANASKGSSGKVPAGSKQDNVLSLLRRPEGASLEALVKATGWQKHSVRGFLAGTVRKKLKLPLVSEKVDGARIYRIGKGKPAKEAKAASSRAA